MVYFNFFVFLLLILPTLVFNLFSLETPTNISRSARILWNGRKGEQKDIQTFTRNLNHKRTKRLREKGNGFKIFEFVKRSLVATSKNLNASHFTAE